MTYYDLITTACATIVANQLVSVGSLKHLETEAVAKSVSSACTQDISELEQLRCNTSAAALAPHALLEGVAVCQARGVTFFGGLGVSSQSMTEIGDFWQIPCVKQGTSVAAYFIWLLGHR